MHAIPEWSFFWYKDEVSVEEEEEEQEAETDPKRQPWVWCGGDFIVLVSPYKSSLRLV